MLNLLWLDDFRVLAATGNFSRAADQRNMTQPAFSRRIRALEEWLGADLFDRSTQPARLTEVGEWFQSIADELLARVARVPGEARIVAEETLGTLRIAATHALSFTFLPRWLRGLESKTAIGPVQLVSDVLLRCEALMVQSKVQFVLSHAHPSAKGILEDDTYRSAKVGEDWLVPVSAPAKAGQPRFRIESAAAEPVQLLQYTAESGLGRIVRAVAGRRLEELRSRIAFTAHLASVLRTMALDGRGLAWLPKTLVEDDLASGKLVPAGGTDWNIPLEIRLYRDTHSRSTASDAFWNAAASTPQPVAKGTGRRKRS